MTMLTDREAIKAYLLSGLNKNLVHGRVSNTQSFLGYFKIPSLTVLSISYLVSIENHSYLFNVQLNVLKFNYHYYKQIN